MPRYAIIVVLALSVVAPAMAAESDDLGPPVSIMKPEPGMPAHKKPARTRRGSSNPVYPIPLPGPQKPAPVPHIDTARPQQKTPPDLVVPQTGRVVPNVPSVGAGRESFQDRSARCASQAGAYGPSITGDRDSYIRSCINQ